jgi:hypothetical protein
MTGTVGAIFNSALQFGSAVGLAAVTSIETSVEATHGGSRQYAGRAAAFWFLAGIIALQFIFVSIFYDRSADHKPQPKHGEPVYPTQLSMHSKEKIDDNNIVVAVLAKANPQLEA